MGRLTLPRDSFTSGQWTLSINPLFLGLNACNKMAAWPMDGPILLHARANLITRKKNFMGRGHQTTSNRHRDSMIKSAQWADLMKMGQTLVNNFRAIFAHYFVIFWQIFKAILSILPVVLVIPFPNLVRKKSNSLWI